MFVPDGYLPLLYVKQACFEIANDRFPPISTDNENDFFQSLKADLRATLYAKLLIERFMEEFCEEIFVFQYPNTLLRAPTEVLFTEKVYDGPCPQDIDERNLRLNLFAQ